MTKRVLLSNNSPGLAAVDAALADLATDASGDGTKALYGDGTFKAPGLTINAAVTPHAGGEQANAVQIAAGITPVNTPANSGDSLQLPAATAGTVCILMPVGPWTSSDLSVSVYVKNGSSDTLNGISDFIDFGAQIGSANEPAPALWCVCYSNGAWLTNGSLD